MKIMGIALIDSKGNACGHSNQAHSHSQLPRGRCLLSYMPQGMPWPRQVSLTVRTPPSPLTFLVSAAESFTPPFILHARLVRTS